uniref:Cytochrome b n=1 Tax=Paratemnoides elongatus TaxID=51805 RepID=H9MFI0_9ARAC|nr:cytochrome b [Paratemnoides elongatus]AEX37725.1 cytochrome b [Paratemnoides elongatus]
MKNMFLSSKPLTNPLFNLPSPSLISYWWNIGSLLGLMLTLQIFSGLLITMNYCPSSLMAFYSISNIMHNLWGGWLIRFSHTVGASMMMLLIYFHVGRNIYYANFKNTKTSLSGLIILLMVMITAFLGYVLPWGQMSFWGATVITSLASVIPFYGNMVVKWLWGNFAVSNSTLNRFFMLHFIIPLLLLVLSLIHISTLHSHGSISPLSFKKNIEMIEFHPKFTFKDLFPLWLIMVMIFIMALNAPFKFMDPENFIIANPLSTPNHIQPEWYFLFSYAILRCIPNKVGGVIALILSIMVVITPMIKTPFMNNSFSPFKKLYFWFMLCSLILLTWVGANPVSEPLIFLAQIYTMLYFYSFAFL